MGNEANDPIPPTRDAAIRDYSLGSEPTSGESDSSVIKNIAEQERTPRQIGHYRILERLGVGGMGEVYKSERRHPIRQIVAIKIIKLGFDSREVIARFSSEQQALARMDHPHIAKVLDAGSTDAGRPYFVMEYVPGLPITTFADQNKLSIKDRLGLFIQVCEAINHAHSKAIIHRDIKASNVLAYLADGRPTVKVIDFGIAKALTGDRLTEQTFNTGQGNVVGTYASMSPEQAEGSPDIDTRTDVYSLGVLLYELLAGMKPFDKNTFKNSNEEEIRHLICEIDPPRPSTRLMSLGDQATRIAEQRILQTSLLVEALRNELEWIPLMAMRKDRQRRYASPLHLAEDIRNYLEDKPLVAGPESTRYRLKKYMVRHRGPLAAAISILLLLTFGVIGMTLLYAQAENQRRFAQAKEADANKARLEAETARQQSEVERDKAEKSFYDASIIASEKSLHDSQIAQARQMLLECPSRYRNWEWGRLEYLCNLDLYSAYDDGSPIQSFAFGPDGAEVACSKYNGTIQLRNSKNAQVIRTWSSNGHGGASIAISPDGKTLAVGSGNKPFRPESHPTTSPSDTSIELWDLPSGNLLGRLYGHTNSVASLAFTPDGQTLASGGLDGQIILWDVRARAEIRRLPRQDGEIRNLSFNRDGTALASAGGNDRNDFCVWDTSSGKRLTRLQPDGYQIYCVSFSPDGSVLAAAGQTGIVYLYDTQTYQITSSFKVAKYFIWSIAWHPSRHVLLVGSRIGAAYVELDRGNLVQPFDGVGAEVTTVGFDPTGQIALVACLNGTLSAWEIPRPGESQQAVLWVPRDEYRTDYYVIGSMDISADNALVAATTRDRFARIWDTISRDEICHLGPHPQTVTSVSFSPDTKYFATTSDIARIWNLRTGQFISLESSGDQGLAWGCFSHDGRLFATAAQSGMVRIWDARTAKLLRSTDQQAPPSSYMDPARSTCCCFSPDDQILAVSTSGPINLWSVTDGQKLRSLGTNVHALRMAFSPDGKLLVSGGQGNQPAVWDVTTGQLLYRLVGHTEGAWGVAFSPDGTRIATASLDGTVRLWDVQSHRQEISIQAPGDQYSVSFSKDGKMLLGAANVAINLWPAFPWNDSDLLSPNDLAGSLESYKRSYRAAAIQEISNHQPIKMSLTMPPSTQPLANQ